MLSKLQDKELVKSTPLTYYFLPGTVASIIFLVNIWLFTRARGYIASSGINYHDPTQAALHIPHPIWSSVKYAQWLYPYSTMVLLGFLTTAFYFYFIYFPKHAIYVLGKDDVIRTDSRWPSSEERHSYCSYAYWRDFLSVFVPVALLIILVMWTSYKTFNYNEVPGILPMLIYFALFFVVPSLIAYKATRWMPMFVAGWIASRTHHPAARPVKRAVALKRPDHTVAQELGRLLEQQMFDDAEARRLYAELSGFRRWTWQLQFQKRMRDLALLREVVQSQEAQARQETALAYDVLAAQRAVRTQQDR